MDFQRINPIHLGFVGLIAVSAIPSLRNVGGFASDLEMQRQKASQINRESTELRLLQQEVDSKEETAIQRYQKGCLPVVDIATRQNYTTLTLNQPVLDGATGAPLPAGSVVCDAHGNTALLVDDDQAPESPAVAQKIAYTGNRAVIEQRLQQFQQANYANPQS